MGGKEANPIVIAAALVIVVALVGYFGYKAVMPPAPPPGSYTPGVPPWLDKNHKTALPAGVHGTP
jgi:hypothetical protein